MNADILRGLAISLLLWGHAIQYSSLGRFDFFTNPVFVLIYSFHLPLFAIVSGYLASIGIGSRSVSEQLSNITRRLLLPVLAWSLVIYLVIYFSPGISSIANFRSFLAFGNQAFHTAANELWFLWVLVISNLLVLFVRRSLRDSVFAYVIVAIVLVLLPRSSMGGAMLAFLYPFFFVGYLIGKNRAKLGNLAAYVSLVSVPLFPLLLLFYNKNTFIYISGISVMHSGWGQQVATDAFRFLIGFVGCGMIYTVVCVLGARVAWVSVKQVFAWFGTNALVIYAAQRVLVERELQRVIPDLTRHPLLYDFVFTPLIAIAVAIVLSALSMLIRKNRVSRAWLLGGR